MNRANLSRLRKLELAAPLDDDLRALSDEELLAHFFENDSDGYAKAMVALAADDWGAICALMDAACTAEENERQ